MFPKKGETKESFIKRAMAANYSLTDAEVIWNNSSCRKTCTGNMGYELVVHSQEKGYTPSYSVFDGRSVIVVPCVMIREGVHSGSAGSVFYPAEEIDKFPMAWNGRPIPLTHPQDGGVPVSCNSPGIMGVYNLGFVFNTQTVSGQLKSELWLFQDRLSEKSPEIMEKINNGEPIEVSTGLWFELDETPGVWNGEEYIGIARNFRPDHLAILELGTIGACSVSDGCGIRVNLGRVKEMEVEELPRYKTAKEAKTFLSVQDYKGKKSYQTIMNAIWKIIGTWDTKEEWYYLEEVGEDYFIYEKNMQGSSTLYKVGYKFNDDETEIIVEENPVEVVLIREYKEKIQMDGGILMNREQMIAKLKTLGVTIAANSGISDEELTALISSFEAKETQLSELAEEKTKLEALAAPGKDTTAEVLAAHSASAGTAGKGMPDMNSWLSSVPKELASVIGNALRRETELKTNLIQALLKDERVSSMFTENELKEKPTEELEKIYRLASIEAAPAPASNSASSGILGGVDFSLLNLSPKKPMEAEAEVEPLPTVNLFDPASAK